MNASYFSNFPTVNYDMNNESNYGRMTDFTKNVGLSRRVKLDYSNYTYYTIPNGARPDVVSQLLYGTPEFYWTFFVINTTDSSTDIMSWPLSSYDFDQMISTEYDAFSAISFTPINSEGIIPCIDLSDKYSSYLRIIPYEYRNEASGIYDGDSYADILKYDYDRCQLIISVKDNNELSRDTFVNGFKSYKIIWNPNDRSIIYDAWLNSTKASYGITSDPQDLIYKSVGENFAWALYKNAAFQYYETDLETGNLVPLKALDVISNSTITSPKFISYYDMESLKNDKASKIKVIRPEVITAFASEYYSTLSK